jgi:hypothetical protein
MTIPEYLNYKKPKEEVKETTERKCLICGKKAKMTKFQRYCDKQCRHRATRNDTATTSIKFK